MKCTKGAPRDVASMDTSLLAPKGSVSITLSTKVAFEGPLENLCVLAIVDGCRCLHDGGEIRLVYVERSGRLALRIDYPFHSSEKALVQF